MPDFERRVKIAQQKKLIEDQIKRADEERNLREGRKAKEEEGKNQKQRAEAVRNSPEWQSMVELSQDQEIKEAIDMYFEKIFTEDNRRKRKHKYGRKSKDPQSLLMKIAIGQEHGRDHLEIEELPQKTELKGSFGQSPFFFKRKVDFGCIKLAVESRSSFINKVAEFLIFYGSRGLTISAYSSGHLSSVLRFSGSRDEFLDYMAKVIVS